MNDDKPTRRFDACSALSSPAPVAFPRSVPRQGSSGNANQEYSIRVPKDVKKKYHVMRFNATLGVDFSKWTSVKMERENNMKEYRSVDEDSPKFGAGSEFGKEAREEARRKKLGFISRKYKPDDQPWILKAGGSLGKKFKGIREGGVSENAAYYVFTHAPDGAIEAYPLNEWYKFQPVQRYKALSAEEAEQEFGKRNKVLNYFSLMLRKRLKGDDEIESEDGDDVKGKRAGAASKKTKELKISDMDEWMDSSDDDDDDDDDDAAGDGSDNEKKDREKQEAKKKKVKKAADAKKKKRDTDLEAFEDSDDGDNEGRELDYISDSSESDNEPVKELKGVAEEKALRKLLTSDEGSDSDEDKSEKEENKDRDNDDDKTDPKETEKEAETKKKNKKKNKKKDASNKKNKKTDKDKTKDSSSDFSSDSSDSETDAKKNPVKKDEEKEKDSNSANSSRSASPARSSALTAKRKRPSSSDLQPVKKPKFDTSLANYVPGSSESGITEDAVRRYLVRKPMTTIELLQKFKSKKTGLSSEKLVNVMTQILKKINPIKQTIKGKMYLSIKPS